ncbi:hypothetical protein [Nannocystis sp. SCPEA4]|uniref:hypothetical protein n=1 Tax=Nannocystis sp. SCPEA4 TaxID=2996787 RepID=UPI00226F8729|nr:hypothetical protein [Nannocystis sp. SCPEA4]MCY1054233.1 hypothetical protein [Nannocystis sp. SCPEA4]
MSACARAITVLALFCGCFSDGGAELTQTVGSFDPATQTSTSTTTTTTTGEPTSTGEPGTTTTTTGEMLTGATAPPLCPGEMQCSPGEVMDVGSLCDPCGRVRRTCQDDCLWGADECVEDPTSCAYWYLDDPEQGWQRVALPQPPPEHAPTAPANAAFDLQAHDQLVVLTADTYHVLRHSDQTWTTSGPLTDLFPDLPGPLLQSYAVYGADNDDYAVYAVGAPQAWIYILKPGSWQGQFTQAGNCCDSFTPQVNPGDPTTVRDLWTDLAAPFPWTGGQYYGPCINELFNLGTYAGWVTATDVFVQDLGWCFQMVTQSPLAQFAPFTAPGAPPGERIGGTALLGERFYVFAGE